MKSSRFKIQTKPRPGHFFFLIRSSLKPGLTVYLDVDMLSGEAAEYRCDADLKNGILKFEIF